MKLASLSHGRDGRLVVVSRDLTRATDAFPVVATLQAALDDWERFAPRLADLAEGLEHGSVPSFRFHEHDCASPLPRALQWLDGSAYVNHVELARRARGATTPENFWTDPLMYQGGSDALLAPRGPIHARSEEDGIDFEGEVAVVTGDVPMGASRDQGLAAIRLVMLANDVSLRNRIPSELAKGFGFVQSKPSSAFSPVAVTPDELGSAWRDGRLHHPLLAQLNGAPFGRPEAGADMTFDFGTLIAHAAATRRLSAGTIIGSGTVSNRDADGGPGKPVAEGGLGYVCIAEQRMVETLRHGEPKTPFLRFGDTVRIEMKDAAGHSIFGAIEQEVLPHG
ncbi:MAG: fumarylacetoacetate hydrolase family protein [Bosea sp.]|uniref:fumarylacetoacetate hydrolase family protein n=1 Tax=unclassified Bosea (in: a-proteobacteria) TaxID=2653178 RepID=UPI00095ECB10|nr:MULTISPECIES: fumarylacetoacetate hydrolase family protein [unclassified Bosea (in: a-proteobacteria)]MBN9456558.1 fumarylacetoacetate hydrolase family protein [Bosea sp. (in: a-proteobacteria)]OJV08799.1 MAG: 2-keto-4-pentenoate hydratase [Bosea sp. 67-29]